MQTKTKRLLLIITACFFLMWGCEEFTRRVIGGFAGSYPFVEYWDINAPESEVIEAILELKKEEPSLQPPGDTELVSKRDTSNERDFWLYINFYYLDTHEKVRTWTRPETKNITTFALISVGGKLINKDYWYVANKMEIHKFKKQLVDRIQAKINEKKTSP